eukprot:scaffold12398_cov155-Skeletonema_dohrnii-CCMP3373.AAC.1
MQTEVGNSHGQGSCFLPLLQNDDEYIAPRIVQIAGAYPGVTTETYLSITSEPAAEFGQWAYDFSDPDGPQLGTVAVPGMSSVYETDDPVVLIGEHTHLGVQLPDEIKDPVDLIVLVDRARKYFAERKFLVMELEENPGMISIGAFSSFEEFPSTAKIMGHVTLVQIPWLPSMQKKKSGFMEEDHEQTTVLNFAEKTRSAAAVTVVWSCSIIVKSTFMNVVVKSYPNPCAARIEVGGATGGAVLGVKGGGAALLLLAPAEAAAMAK